MQRLFPDDSRDSFDSNAFLDLLSGEGLPFKFAAAAAQRDSKAAALRAVRRRWMLWQRPRGADCRG